MKAILLATACVFTAVATAHAANITAFSQTSGSNTITATTNVGNTQTTLDITNAAISIGQFIAPNPLTAFLSLDATSNDAAFSIVGAVIQHYDGTFCITSAASCGGINYLSGTFSDAAFGALGGPGLVVNVNNPPDTLTLTSSVVPANLLAAPNSLGLSFTNLSPALAILGTTIAPFTASFSGNVSASAIEVPEPMSLALLGVGLLGIGLVRRVS